MNSFRRKKYSFYVILKRKYSFHRDSNPRSMDYEANSLPLSYLTRWWWGLIGAYYSRNTLWESASARQIELSSKTWFELNLSISFKECILRSDCHHCIRNLETTSERKWLIHLYLACIISPIIFQMFHVSNSWLSVSCTIIKSPFCPLLEGNRTLQKHGNPSRFQTFCWFCCLYNFLKFYTCRIGKG